MPASAKERISASKEPPARSGHRNGPRPRNDEARDIRDCENLCAGETAGDARRRQGAGDRREHFEGRPADADHGAAGWRPVRAGGRASPAGSLQATRWRKNSLLPRAGASALAPSAPLVIPGPSAAREPGMTATDFTETASAVSSASDI